MSKCFKLDQTRQCPLPRFPAPEQSVAALEDFMKLRTLFLASTMLLSSVPAFVPAYADDLDSQTAIVMDLDTKDIDVADGITIGDLSGGVGTAASDEGGPIVMQFVQQPVAGASTGTAAGSRYVAASAGRR